MLDCANLGKRMKTSLAQLSVLVIVLKNETIHCMNLVPFKWLPNKPIRTLIRNGKVRNQFLLPTIAFRSITEGSFPAIWRVVNNKTHARAIFSARIPHVCSSLLCMHVPGMFFSFIPVSVDPLPWGHSTSRAFGCTLHGGRMLNKQSSFCFRTNKNSILTTESAHLSCSALHHVRCRWRRGSGWLTAKRWRSASTALKNVWHFPFSSHKPSAKRDAHAACWLADCC